MITKKRVVLKTQKRYPFFERFEALEYIENIEKIQSIWKKNKTPIIIDNNSSCLLDSMGYEHIGIPQALIGNIDGFIDFCHHHEGNP